MNIKNILYKWREIYSYVIPTVLTALYLIYMFLDMKGVIDVKLLQESESFDKMLQTIVTFMSIILSVFGFLIPFFIGGKEQSKAINYFMRYADMRLFAAKLRNIVAFGLIDIFLTSFLLLVDIIPLIVLNIAILFWLWSLFFFMCSSYRFISLLINLLLVEKKPIVQNTVNKVSNEEKEKLHNNIRSI